jgi:invasion protein IalB
MDRPDSAGAARRRHLTAALALGLIAGTPAAAQTDNAVATAPQTTTATYRDWTLRCDNAVGTPPRRVCEVAQTVMAQGGKTALAQIVIGRPGPGEPLKLIVQLPNGVWLPANAILALGDKTTVTATYKRCVQLCFADADIDEAALAALKARTDPARLLFADGTQRIVELPLSLDGFAAALDASLKDVAAQ